ncbi:MAG: HIT family protein [Candidatus Micrarchaeaceae archaeon]
MMHNDAFCRKEIYEQVYYETKRTMVAYDIMPSLPGHSLVIPKRHVESINEMSAPEMLDIYNVLRKVIPVLLRVYGADSYILTAQVGKNSGMSINHLHFHLIPRSKTDKYHNNTSKLYEMLKEDKSRRAYITKNRRALRERIEKDVAMLRKEFRYRHYASR